MQHHIPSQARANDEALERCSRRVYKDFGEFQKENICTRTQKDSTHQQHYITWIPRWDEDEPLFFYPPAFVRTLRSSTNLIWRSHHGDMIDDISTSRPMWPVVQSSRATAKLIAHWRRDYFCWYPKFFRPARCIYKSSYMFDQLYNTKS